MIEPNPIDRAIAQCDRLLDNIDRIHLEMQDACAKAQKALSDVIEKLKGEVK